MAKTRVHELAKTYGIEISTYISGHGTLDIIRGYQDHLDIKLVSEPDAGPAARASQATMRT